MMRRKCLDFPVPILSPSDRTGCAPAYELCSAWFLIALSMPEKIIA